MLARADVVVSNLPRHSDQTRRAPTGVPSKEEVRRALFTTLAANGMRDGVHVRLTLSRGLKTTSSMNPGTRCRVVMRAWAVLG